MNTTITQKQRYLPHTLETKHHAVKTYRAGCSIMFVCRKYKISKASLMRWNKKFDGTKESLIDKSHRPHSKHPNAHTDNEIKHIKNYIKRNPIELYAKLKKYKGYKRHPCSLFRVLKNRIFQKQLKRRRNHTSLRNIILLNKLEKNGNLLLSMSLKSVMLVIYPTNSTNIQ